MGIALSTFNDFFAPLHALGSWLSRAAAPRRPAMVSVANNVHPEPATGHFHKKACRSRPLRVLRVVDASNTRSAAGRMVISGRMADVCAELDRLAALESPVAQACAPAR